MEQEISYIYNIPKINKKSSSDNTKRFLELLDADNSGSKIIHVAGTNGKGSVCAYLTGILLKAGYSVGTFTSPHLVRINERISYNGSDISDKAFESIFEEAKAVAQKMVQQGYEHPSFFEFLFGMAMKYYKIKKPEYIILETGLGGRLDATNIFEAPVLTVITSISLDHTEILGDTLEKIAFEKAGIIKKGVPVVYPDDKKEVSNVIESVAKKMNAKPIAVSKDSIYDVCSNHKSIDFFLHNEYYDKVQFTINTIARYQLYNASEAITAAGILNIPAEHVAAGIRDTFWIGRMQDINGRITVDGGHNDDGISRFIESVRFDGCSTKRTLLFSAVKDKHYSEMIKKLCESRLFDDYVLAPLDDARALSTDEMVKYFSMYTDRYRVCDNIPKGYEAAVLNTGNKVYAVGSLYMAGELLAAVKQENDND